MTDREEERERGEMGLESALWGSVPFVAMVLVECAEVGIATISKAAMRQGMSKLVFLVYYNAFGTLLLFPYFIFRRNKRPPLSFTLVGKFFLLGLIGMETLNLRRSSGLAKSLGTIVSVMGAMVVTLYKGPAILRANLPSNLLHHFLNSQQSKWIFGGFLLSINSLVSAVWNIGQAATVKEYPEEMTIVFFYTLFVTIQIFIFSLIVETNPDTWKLKPGIEIVAIVYAAIFVSVLRIGVHVWCLHKKGPVYVAMFKPLGIAIAVVMVVTFLGETLHLGSVIGSVAIVAGFYTVIWGQIKEKKNNDDQEQQVRDGSLESSTQRSPLLKTNINKEEGV